MFVESHIRSIGTLHHDEIVALARSQAERGEPCVHGYEPGSPQSCTWERHYIDRRRDLEERSLDT